MAQSLTGPWGTPGVRGTIGSTTFSRGKQGQTVLKMKPIPTNPRTTGQQANRGAFGFISREWQNLDAEDQQSYTAAAQANLIGDNAQYTKDNSLRVAANKAPSQNRAAAELLTPAAASGELTPATVDSPAVLDLAITGDADTWGLMVYHRSGGPPTGVKSQIIAVLKVATGAQTLQVEHAGGIDSEYAVRSFSVDGKFGDLVQIVEGT
jgi:hypothetical protein